MSDVVPADQFERLPERYRQRARQIAKRVEDISALMGPCEPDVIRDAVIRLRAQLRPQPDTETTDMLAEFKAACRDLPEWAVSEATNDFLGGRVENHTGQFMPTCAEFARRARSIMLPYLSERAALKTEAGKLVERAEDEHRRNLIAIERADPGVRERTTALLEQFKAGAPKRLPLPREGVDPEQQKRLDALKKPRQFESRLAETKIVKRASKSARAGRTMESE